MNFLGEQLQARGFSVLRAAFKGHCRDTAQADYLSVSSDDWIADARRSYREAHNEAVAKKIPLFLVSYSFSALIFNVLEKELSFSKKVFFAPALAMKYWYPYVHTLSQWFPDLPYFTMNRHGRAKNNHVSLRAVFAFDQLKEKYDFAQPSADSLIWLDPADELVSLDGLKELLGHHTNWRLNEVEVNRANVPHHLIVEKEAFSPEKWKSILEESTNFLRVN